MFANPPGKTAGRKLGILVLSRQSPGDLKIICAIAQAAANKGVHVQMFLMGEGVLHLGEPCLQKALKEGVRVSFCALNAMQRGMDQHPQYPWGADESSQYELACMVEGSDRFLAFT